LATNTETPKYHGQSIDIRTDYGPGDGIASYSLAGCESMI
jgi:hypothetical protein